MLDNPCYNIDIFVGGEENSICSIRMKRLRRKKSSRSISIRIKWKCWNIFDRNVTARKFWIISMIIDYYTIIIYNIYFKNWIKILLKIKENFEYSFLKISEKSSSKLSFSNRLSPFLLKLLRCFSRFINLFPTLDNSDRRVDWKEKIRE